MAVSVVVAVHGVGDALVQKISERLPKVVVGDGFDPASEMGPLVTREHRDKVAGYLDSGREQGATVVADGRETAPAGDGFFLGVSLLDDVTTEMDAYRDEIFGPVLSVVRAETYEDAIELVNANPYGNGVALFTRDGGVARQFQFDVNVGMVGINVPIPVPVAYYSFGGWKASLFGDPPSTGRRGSTSTPARRSSRVAGRTRRRARSTSGSRKPDEEFHQRAPRSTISWNSSSVTLRCVVPGALAALGTAATLASAAPSPTTAELVGSRLVVAMRGTSPSPALLGRVRRGEVAGVILFGGNVDSAPQVRALTASLQDAASAGGHDRLLVCVDQEGGSVRRLRWLGPAAAATLGRGTAQEVRAAGRATGRALAGLGINCDLAPVADVPVTGSFLRTRAFSRDAARTASRANAFALGLAMPASSRPRSIFRVSAGRRETPIWRP